LHYLIRDKGMSEAYGAQSSIYSEWTLAQSEVCQFGSFSLHNPVNDVEFTESDAISSSMQKQDSSGTLSFQTNIPLAGGVNQMSYHIKARATASNPSVKKWITIKVYVGCWRETSLTAVVAESISALKVKSSGSAPHFVLITRKVKASLVDSTQESTYTEVFDLATVLTWTTNIPLCGPGRL